MSSARKLFDAFKASDGRIRVATLFGISGLVIAMVVFLMLPAIAGAGDPSAKGVQPTEVAFGGGSGACAVYEPGTTELWINNPMDGSYPVAGIPGLTVTLDVYDADTRFDFAFSGAPAKAAYSVIVNGGSQNTWFDYDGSIGPVRDDQRLHAPTRGGGSRLFNLSHINFCIGDFVPNASGVKFHDRDTAGDLDDSFEEELAGFTIAAIPTSGETRTTTTGPDGSYVFGNLPAGTYTICEATGFDGGLPDPASGTGFEWNWAQSAPDNDLCSGLGDYEPGGYSVEVLAGDTPAQEDTGLNFGNYRQLTVTCQANQDVIVSSGDDGEDEVLDNPLVTVTFPAGCPSAEYVTPLETGRNDDNDDTVGQEFDQFVVFLGDPDEESIVLEQTIVWDPEDADYETNPGFLTVANTKVILGVGGTLQDVVFCSALTPPGSPNLDEASQCLVNRVIDEGEPLPAGKIQLTENYKFLGDPPNFR